MIGSKRRRHKEQHLRCYILAHVLTTVKYITGYWPMHQAPEHEVFLGCINMMLYYYFPRSKHPPLGYINMILLPPAFPLQCWHLIRIIQDSSM